MQIDDKTYKRWANLAKVICSDKDMAEDILHNLLLALIEKKVDEDKINDNYIFISLRNRFLAHINKESKTKDGIPIDLVEEESDHELQEQEHELQSKLLSIEQVVFGLRSYEQKLYALHFIHGVSQRQIARETGIGLSAINKRIVKIKSKIKAHHNGKENN